MKRILLSAVVAVSAMLATGIASARDVAWSVSVGSHGGGAIAIGVPGMVMPAPVYAPPVYAPPVVYAPAPRVYYPAPRVYYPAPRVYYPAPRYAAHPVSLPYYGHPWHAVVPAHGHRGKGHWKHRGHRD